MLQLLAPEDGYSRRSWDSCVELASVMQDTRKSTDESATRGVSPPGAPPTISSTVTTTGGGGGGGAAPADCIAL